MAAAVPARTEMFRVPAVLAPAVAAASTPGPVAALLVEMVAKGLTEPVAAAAERSALLYLFELTMALQFRLSTVPLTLAH